MRLEGRPTAIGWEAGGDVQRRHRLESGPGRVRLPRHLRRRARTGWQPRRIGDGSSIYVTERGDWLLAQSTKIELVVLDLTNGAEAMTAVPPAWFWPEGIPIRP
jgi:hypothetical protein